MIFVPCSNALLNPAWYFCSSSVQKGHSFGYRRLQPWTFLQRGTSAALPLPRGAPCLQPSPWGAATNPRYGTFGPRSQFKNKTNTPPHYHTVLPKKRAPGPAPGNRRGTCSPLFSPLPNHVLAPTAASLRRPVGIQLIRTPTGEPPTCSTSRSTPKPRLFSQASADPQSVFTAPSLL